MQIGQLAAATGVPARTVRFYEDRGILPEPDRTPSGYRDYDDAAIGRLRFLRSAQEAGLTLAEIQSILAIRERGDAPCAHTRDLLDAKREEITQRIAQLRELRTDLGRLLDAGQLVTEEICDPASVCSIIPS